MLWRGQQEANGPERWLRGHVRAAAAFSVVVALTTSLTVLPPPAYAANTAPYARSQTPLAR